MEAGEEKGDGGKECCKGWEKVLSGTDEEKLIGGADCVAGFGAKGLEEDTCEGGGFGSVSCWMLAEE